MIEKVKAYIAKEIGLEPHATVFIALSGGADSTALLLIMKELGYKLHALHCNVHLRREESASRMMCLCLSVTSKRKHMRNSMA